jgi:hypothetical protein
VTGEVAEAGARVNGKETGRAVVGGERAGEGMGGMRDLMSGPGLSDAAQARALLGCLGRGRRGGGGGKRALARLGPGMAQPRGECFFLFLFSITHFHFLFLFLFISFYFESTIS